jgi:endonuclease/exonuclease/phosphatase family metal-dependent hydrolase
MPADSGLSVMTYNVEGLPWPVRLGRDAAIERITERLGALRRLGRQPHIVVLQEAFTDAAKRIGPDSGYRYVAGGPTRDLRAEGSADPTDIAFASLGTHLKGEGMGKLVDSGLQIFSDYPILAVRRAAFPAEVCAGYDCLANKGVVMALVAVPGSPTPLAIIDTHLNSRRAAHVSFRRSLYAYRRQLEALDAFLRSEVPPGLPLILAGDFNVGRDRHRQAAFSAHLADWSRDPKNLPLREALRTCFAPDRPCGTLPRDASFSRARGRDRQLFIPSNDTAMTVRGVAVPFGHEADGTMLSDHVGYTAYYTLSELRDAMPIWAKIGFLSK